MKLCRWYSTALLAILALSTNAFSAELDKKTIDLIVATVDSICSKPDSTEGSEDRVQIKGQIDANLAALLKQIASAGANVSLDYVQSKYNNVSRDKLADLIANRLACRREVFKDLSAPILQAPPKKQSSIDTERATAANLVARLDLSKAQKISDDQKWSSYVVNTKGGPICFCTTTSINRNPNVGNASSRLFWSFGKERDAVYTSVRPPVSIDQNQDISATIQPATYKFATDGKVIFLNSFVDSRSINSDMNNDKQLVLSYVASGESVTEIYSFKGFVGSLRSAFQTCFRD